MQLTDCNMRAGATWADQADISADKKPMNCVTWFEAMAFCAWDGGFLPTEAEWNYVAAGGNEQRSYPWSSPASSLTIDCSYADYYDGNYCVNPPTGAVDRVGSTSPKGDGKWGHADLGGNVVQWALDSYQSSYANPCNDCADLTSSSLRVIRGGGYRDAAPSLRGASRNGSAPAARFGDIGARCARSAM
jgi:formylglycine-generating enzyme required for sulfatase activity